MQTYITVPNSTASLDFADRIQPNIKQDTPRTLAHRLPDAMQTGGSVVGALATIPSAIACNTFATAARLGQVATKTLKNLTNPSLNQRINRLCGKISSDYFSGIRKADLEEAVAMSPAQAVARFKFYLTTHPDALSEILIPENNATSAAFTETITSKVRAAEKTVDDFIASNNAALFGLDENPSASYKDHLRSVLLDNPALYKSVNKHIKNIQQPQSPEHQGREAQKLKIKIAGVMLEKKIPEIFGKEFQYSFQKILAKKEAAIETIAALANKFERSDHAEEKSLYKKAILELLLDKKILEIGERLQEQPLQPGWENRLEWAIGQSGELNSALKDALQWQDGDPLAMAKSLLLTSAPDLNSLVPKVLALIPNNYDSCSDRDAAQFREEVAALTGQERAHAGLIYRGANWAAEQLRQGPCQIKPYTQAELARALEQNQKISFQNPTAILCIKRSEAGEMNIASRYPNAQLLLKLLTKGREQEFAEKIHPGEEVYVAIQIADEEFNKDAFDAMSALYTVGIAKERDGGAVADSASNTSNASQNHTLSTREELLQGGDSLATHGAMFFEAAFTQGLPPDCTFQGQNIAEFLKDNTRTYQIDSNNQAIKDFLNAGRSSLPLQELNLMLQYKQYLLESFDLRETLEGVAVAGAIGGIGGRVVDSAFSSDAAGEKALESGLNLVLQFFIDLPDNYYGEIGPSNQKLAQAGLSDSVVDTYGPEQPPSDGSVGWDRFFTTRPTNLPLDGWRRMAMLLLEDGKGPGGKIVADRLRAAFNGAIGGMAMSVPSILAFTYQAAIQYQMPATFISTIGTSLSIVELFRETLEEKIEAAYALIKQGSYRFPDNVNPDDPESVAKHVREISIQEVASAPGMNARLKALATAPFIASLLWLLKLHPSVPHEAVKTIVQSLGSSMENIVGAGFSIYGAKQGYLKSFDMLEQTILENKLSGRDHLHRDQFRAPFKDMFSKMIAESLAVDIDGGNPHASENDAADVPGEQQPLLPLGGERPASYA